MFLTNKLRRPFIFLAALIGATLTVTATFAVPGADPKPTIVLVHGAFADASSWQEVIPQLQDAGYKVVAVQNAMASLTGDVETTRRAIDAQAGNVVVVGHSYAGAVITGAAAGNPRVKSLVYIAAFAPEPGEPVNAFLEKYPSDLGTATAPDSAGFVFVDSAKFRDVIAGDVAPRQAKVMAATQRPIYGEIFGQSVDVAAWKVTPSWYLVTTQDHALNTELQRFYAQRAHAHTVEIKSSHVAMVSHPREVAKLIEDAATQAGS